MTTKPKAFKGSAGGAGVNPKLIALAAKIDTAKTEFNRALEHLAPAEQNAWHNREDQAAQSALGEANAAELAAGDASGMAAEKFSKVRATNLEELILKAHHAEVDFIDDVVALSIIRDLRALGAKPVSKSSRLRRTA